MLPLPTKLYFLEAIAANHRLRFPPPCYARTRPFFPCLVLFLLQTWSARRILVCQQGSQKPHQWGFKAEEGSEGASEKKYRGRMWDSSEVIISVRDVMGLVVGPSSASLPHHTTMCPAPRWATSTATTPTLLDTSAGYFSRQYSIMADSDATPLAEPKQVVYCGGLSLRSTSPPRCENIQDD